jgi:hypothetical protein
MVTLATVVILNAACAFAMGATLNAVLLCWAIRRHTPEGLRPYARLLRQTCLTDMALLLVHGILIPVGVHTHTHFWVLAWRRFRVSSACYFE